MRKMSSNKLNRCLRAGLRPGARMQLERLYVRKEIESANNLA